jgi:hypothetical protein
MLRSGQFASLDEAARFAGVSRQRVHQWAVMHGIDWNVARERWLAVQIAKEDARMARRKDYSRGLHKPSEDHRHQEGMMAPLLRAQAKPYRKRPAKVDLRAEAEAAIASGVKVKRLPPGPR